jgi:hypothetical protein
LRRLHRRRTKIATNLDRTITEGTGKLIADSGGLAMGAGATDDFGDAGGSVVSGGTASATEPNPSSSAVDNGEVAFDTIVVSGATELLAHTGGGTEFASLGVEDFGAQIAAGGITVSAGVVSGTDAFTGSEIGGGGLVTGGGEPFSARISSASAEFALVPAWSAAATTDPAADTALTVAGGGAVGVTVSASGTDRFPVGETGVGDTTDLLSGHVPSDAVVGGGNVVGS